MIEFHAKIIFVNGSTLGSTFVLLNSISNRFPNGLGNDSGVLGKYLMDHHFKIGASGVAEGYEDKYFYGRRANGLYIPRYRNIGSDKRDYIRGFGYQGGASRSGWSRGIAEMGAGKDFKEMLTEPGQWSMGIGGFGECLPYEDNTVVLDNSQKKTHGASSVMRFNAEFKEKRSEDAYRYDERCGRNAGSGGHQECEDLRQRLLAGHGHPRDGHCHAWAAIRKLPSSMLSTRCIPFPTCS